MPAETKVLHEQHALSDFIETKVAFVSNSQFASEHVEERWHRQSLLLMAMESSTSFASKSKLSASSHWSLMAEQHLHIWGSDAPLLKPLCVLHDLANQRLCLQAKAAQQLTSHVLESGGVCISCQHRSCLELKQQQPTIRYACRVRLPAAVITFRDLSLVKWDSAHSLADCMYACHAS